MDLLGGSIPSVKLSVPGELLTIIIKTSQYLPVVSEINFIFQVVCFDFNMDLYWLQREGKGWGEGSFYDLEVSWGMDIRSLDVWQKHLPHL